MSKSTSPSQSSPAIQSTTSAPIKANPPDTVEPSSSGPNAVESFRQYANFKHYVSLTFLFLSPVLIVIPPRKLDFYTFSLAGAWTLSANQLISERYEGRGALQVWGESRLKRLQRMENDRGQQWDNRKNRPEVQVEVMGEPFTKIRRGKGNDGLKAAAAAVVEPKNVAGNNDKNNDEDDEEGNYWEFIKKQIREVWRVDDTGGEKKSKG